MKILLCTPYLDSPQVFQGGIGAWARNILDYYQSQPGDIEIEKVSFDRRYAVSSKSTKLDRIWFGIRDYSRPIFQARKLLRKEHYDVLHLCTSAQMSLYKDWFVLKIAKRFGAKAVVHFHFGRIPELLEKKNWECRMLLKVCKAADTIIVMDKRSQHALLALGYKNVYNLPNPLSSAIMQQVEAKEGKTERLPKKLLYVGSLIRTKGIYELIQACGKCSGYELHIAGRYGDGFDDVLKQRAATYRDKGEWLHLSGHLSHEEVLGEMLSSTAFLFPSHTEGFPNVILEAMACGCPIVTTMVGAIPEMLNHEGEEVCGICVPPQNEEAFYAGIQQMLNHPDFAQQCTANAKKRVHELYAIPVVWDQLSNIWRNTSCQD